MSDKSGSTSTDAPQAKLSPPADGTSTAAFPSQTHPQSQIDHPLTPSSPINPNNQTVIHTSPESQESKLVPAPTTSTVNKLTRIMRYLIGTKDKGITYRKGCGTTLTAYTDSDWAGSTSDSRSTSGYVFMLAGAAISWKSMKQSVVALSTAEAEYIAAAEGSRENYAIRRLMEVIGAAQDKPTPFNIDNTIANQYIKDDNNDKKRKHINTKFHYVREQWKAKELTPGYIPTDKNVADIFTKPLVEVKFIPFRTQLLGENIRTTQHSQGISS
jgi:hypothetical protein